MQLPFAINETGARIEKGARIIFTTDALEGRGVMILTEFNPRTNVATGYMITAEQFAERYPHLADAS